MIQPYASRTGTRQNLDQLRLYGWGLLISASGVLRDEGFDLLMIDNGAWSAYIQGKPWDEGRFQTAVDVFGARARVIITPDKVAGGLESLRLSESWIPRLYDIAPQVIPVQNGMTPADVRPLLSDRVGIFVGGTTDWKLATMRQWGDLAKDVDCYLHIGRVNSARRIQLCQDAGADSFDGTSASVYSVTTRPLDLARRQSHLWTHLRSFQLSSVSPEAPTPSCAPKLPEPNQTTGWQQASFWTMDNPPRRKN